MNKVWCFYCIIKCNWNRAVQEKLFVCFLISIFERRSIPYTRSVSFSASLAGIIHGWPVLDVSLTPSHKLFCRAMLDTATYRSLVCLHNTWIKASLKGFAISDLQGSVVATGLPVILLEDYLPQAIHKLWPPSYLNYRAHHGPILPRKVIRVHLGEFILKGNVVNLLLMNNWCRKNVLGTTGSIKSLLFHMV